jgi:protein disulfide-isomerase A6
LDKRTLAAAKLDEIKVKANILNAFKSKKVEKTQENVDDAAESAAQKVKEEL